MSSYQLPSPSEEPMRGRSTGEPPAPHSRRILVADDEPAIRALLEKALSREGYLVDVAVDGQEAWRAMEARPYDCFIVDLKMPRVSGRELYERLETMDRRLTRKLILMTGDTVTGGIRDFMRSTGNPIMEKPLDLHGTLRQVRRVLETASGGERDEEDTAPPG